MKRIISPLQFTAGLLVGAVFFTVVASAWTGPTATAPGGNVAAPLNVGSIAQVKNGVLGLNGLAVFGNTILQGSSYLNFGSTSGTNGYGIWDNNGVLNFKNNGGTWQTLQAVVSGIQPTGFTGSITLPDVTVTVPANNAIGLYGSFTVDQTPTINVVNGLIISVTYVGNTATISEPRCDSNQQNCKYQAAGTAQAICTASGYTYVSDTHPGTSGAYGAWNASQGKFVASDQSCTSSCNRVSQVVCTVP